MLEKLTNMVAKCSQNLSKIDPGGALEASWEPPLKQGVSKTSFLTILAPFWDPLWDHFAIMFGIIFVDVFLECRFEGFGLHLGSQNRVPKKQQKVMILSTPERGQSVVNISKINEFQLLVSTHSWVSFWRCLESPNGG